MPPPSDWHSLTLLDQVLSLNLLPPDRQRRIRLRAELRRWQAAVSLVLVAALLTNLAALAGEWWLGQRQTAVKAEIQVLQTDSDQSSAGRVTKQIRQLNGTLDPLAAALPRSRAWSTDLTTFLNGLPASIDLTSLSLSLLGDLELNGLAATRADFLALDTFLKQHPALTNVQTDSLANKPENLPFDYTAKLKPPTP